MHSRLEEPKVNPYIPPESEWRNYRDLASDESIRETLARFGVVLHQAIRDAGRFFSASVGKDLKDTELMTSTEEKLWESITGVRKLIQKEIANGNVYTAALDGDQLLLEGKPQNLATEQDTWRQNQRRGNRVNLDQVIYSPVSR